MRQRTSSAIAFLIAIGATATAHAGWSELVNKISDKVASGGAGTATVLSNDDVIAGLKEALANGTRRAVDALGRPDGYLRRPEVHIPLPDSLATIAKGMRGLGQGRYADQLETTLNRAAERAVPEAAPVFADAVRNMNLEDARRILKGPDDAATKYFRKTGGKRLYARMRPLVSEATDAGEVSSAYKQLQAKAGMAAKLLGLKAPDLDGYVTNKALDGLFLLIAAEEKRIRENPAARTTELLKRVFGAR